MTKRDRFDSTRDLAPLRVAQDAKILDTTDLSIDQVVDAVVKLAQAGREND